MAQPTKLIILNWGTFFDLLNIYMLNLTVRGHASVIVLSIARSSRLCPRRTCEQEHVGFSNSAACAKDTRTHVGPYWSDLRWVVIGQYTLGRSLMDRLVEWRQQNKETQKEQLFSRWRFWGPRGGRWVTTMPPAPSLPTWLDACTSNKLNCTSMEFHVGNRDNCLHAPGICSCLGATLKFTMLNCTL